MARWQDSVKRRKRKVASFNPSHEEVSKAVEDFLTGGGQIVHVEPSDYNFSTFLRSHDYGIYADEFFFET